MRRLLGTRWVLGMLSWGVLLGLAYGQSPLYTSNQNQYFLHGFAQAGVGNLSADWLAGTRDPTPLFSLLVRFMAATTPEIVNYAAYLLFFALYLGSLLAIAEHLFGLSRSKSSTWLFMAILFAFHSAALRSVLGNEWQYLFDGGLGGQRLLGPVFQPSVFGVLLLVSIWRYLEGDLSTAILAAVFAAWMHPTYLLSAGALAAAYWIAQLKQARDLREPLKIAALATLLLLPIVAYVYLAFFPPSAAAQEILVEFRIPSHAIPAEWFDLSAMSKLALITTATFVVRRTPLQPVILISIGVGGGLTLFQLITDSNSLALLFPWRISTYLVPLSTAVLTAKIALLASRWISNPGLVRVISLAIVLLAVLSGITWSAIQFVEREQNPERKVFAFVSQSVAPGDLYLIPPKMQDFRLATGAPALADFKSIPYRGGELLEWYERVRMLGWFYRKRVADIDCGLLESFAADYGVTHVLLGPDQHELRCPALDSLYDDGSYRVDALNPAGR